MSSTTNKYAKNLQFYETLRGRSILGINNYIREDKRYDRAADSRFSRFLDEILKSRELDFKVKNVSIANLRKCRNYRGWRHSANLPCNGQRTHTNSKTRRKYLIK